MINISYLFVFYLGIVVTMRKLGRILGGESYIKYLIIGGQVEE